MGKNPAFQFYPGDWTRDLDDQDIEVEGAWIRIMCRLWWSPVKGEATKPLREWARILRKTEQKTIKILQILIEKHIADGSVLDNQNITIISRRMKRSVEISKLRYEVGLKGGNPALKKSKNNLDNQSSNQNARSSTSTSTSIYNNTTTLKNGKTKKQFVLPEWIPQDIWTTYLETRTKKRASKTDNALWLVVGELEKIKRTHNQDPVEVLKKSIRSGWTDVYPLKEDKANVGIRTIRSDPSDKTLQTKQDAECARITAEWAERKAAGHNSRRTANDDNAQDI
ncbi:MAG: hypothetical protein WC926_05395 [Candidatus Paceibacterota bacterium]|jgi:hypothetical protein